MANQVDRFEGRTAIVTGGGSGIGLAIATTLASEGAQLLIVGPDEDVLEAAQSSLLELTDTVHTRRCELSDPDQIDELVAASELLWSNTDILVNCAGTDRDGSFLDLARSDWRYIMSVNVDAPFQLTQGVARRMVKNGGGVVVNIGSIAALGAEGPYTCYSTSKAALLAMTRSLAVELGPLGVRANVVSPGNTRTDSLFGTPAQVEYMTNAFVRAPLGRLVERDEVSAAVAFLASDAASGITGTNVVVDCGLTANLYISETFPD